MPPSSVYLIPVLAVFALLFGWLFGRSRDYPEERTLAIACALYVPVRVLIAVMTDDTTVGEAVLRGILLGGVLYGAARFTRRRQSAT